MGIYMIYVLLKDPFVLKKKIRGGWLMDYEKFLKNRSGLTMSEALFTLAIIGVIASLTMFGLLAKVNDAKNIAALNKI